MSDAHLTQEELQADIEAQRAHLADTVDQLSHKLDVKAQARERLDRIGPQRVAVALGALAALGVLFWWSRRR